MPQFDFDYSNKPTDPGGSTGKSFNGELTNQDYRHAVVNSREHDVSSLLTTISGFSYNVNYYSQILGSNDEPRPFDPGQDVVFQQYQKIQNYELKLQDSISQTFDPQDNRLTAQGSALTYPYLKPNIGDAFIGDIGDGQAGLFTVTEAVKKTRFKQTTYEIQFELLFIVDADIETTIDDRTVKTSYFVRDYIRFGKDPVLTSERYNAGALLAESIDELLMEYLSEFYSHEYSTLLVPSNNKSVYDPFVIKTLLTLFDVTDHPLLSKIGQLNTDDAQFERYIDIWSVLLKQQITLIDNCFSEVQVLSARSFSKNVLLRTIAFSGIDLVVLPIARNLTVDDVLGLTRMHTVPRNDNVGGDTIISPETDTTAPPGSIPEVEGSPQYIFTTAFYETTKVSPEQSDFENLVKRYLNKEHLDYRELLEFSTQINEWSHFQRFYLIPVLLILMIYKQRSI